MARKKQVPSNNFCILCGRITNDKKRFGEEWDNSFFACNKCQKVWCANCFGQLKGVGAKKAYRSGKKGQVTCPDCNQFMPMVRLPENLPFSQIRPQSQDSGETKACVMCGQRIKQGANFCDYCGSKQ